MEKKKYGTNYYTRVTIMNLQKNFNLQIFIIHSISGNKLQLLNAGPKLIWKTNKPVFMPVVAVSKNEMINKIYNIKTIHYVNVIVKSIKYFYKQLSVNNT